MAKSSFKEKCVIESKQRKMTIKPRFCSRHLATTPTAKSGIITYNSTIGLACHARKEYICGKNLLLMICRICPKLFKAILVSGLRDSVNEMIGGVLKTQECANENGVDALGKDALDAVKKTQPWMDGGKLE
jgi:hypothetical protein